MYKVREMTPQEYNKIHQYHLRWWVKKGICEFCRKDIKTEWANKTGRYVEGLKSDWYELCHKCHREYDMANGLRKKRSKRCVYCRKLTRNAFPTPCFDGWKSSKGGKVKKYKYILLCSSCKAMEKRVEIALIEELS